MGERPHRDAPEKVLLFISHSSVDHDLAEALTTLIDRALEVPHNTMRCASVSPYKLAPGENTPERLRRDLVDSKVVLGLITNSSRASSWVWAELGAAWGFNCKVIPIVAATLKFEDIPEPIGKNIVAVKADDRTAMEDLLRTISRECGMATRGNLVGPIEEFLEKAKKYGGGPVGPSGPVEVLGNFPAFIPDITKAIENAPDHSRIQIACDYVGYGMFNASERSDLYRDALMKAKSRGCAVHMLVLGSEPWKQMLTQLSDADDKRFGELQETAEFSHNLNALHDRAVRLGITPSLPWTRTSQLELLVDVELRYEEMFKSKDIQITFVRGPLPLHLWITESEAVWAIVPLEPKERFHSIDWDLVVKNRIDPKSPLDEYGFFTREEGLVQRLRNVWRQYRVPTFHAASVSGG
jgi:hypothetical protein